MQGSKQILKRAIDLVLLVLLPLLMAEIQIGQEIHEWLGVGMFVLFVAHHLLNLGWWKRFAVGRYTPLRAMGTAIDLLLLLDMLALCASGVMMSGFVFRFLNLHGGMALARRLHLFAAHWGFILMSAHFGLHVERFFSLFRKWFRLSGENRARRWVMRIAAAALSAYGLYAFFNQQMPRYLFLQTHFVLFDETKTPAVYFAELVAMMGLFATAAYTGSRLLRKAGGKPDGKRASGRIAKVAAFAIPVLACVLVAAGLAPSPKGEPWQKTPTASAEGGENQMAETKTSSKSGQPDRQTVPEDGFVRIRGGRFAMGSPEDEPWRSADETRHTVTVSDFYMSPYEVRQDAYAAVMGKNPSNFVGDDLPVENVSWLDAIAFCNALSEREHLTPAYTVDGETVTWDRSANGYRLPTEAEWEYACRAGTTTPFNTETSIGPEACNYYGHYPYEIEENYFSQEKLSTKPGEYRQTTVAVDSFSPNAWGLYNMHGNVSEWVWDYYGAYNRNEETDPTGPERGTRRVYRGGGWNDFAKNLRAAYRAALPQDKGSFNLGIRLVRGAANGAGSIVSAGTDTNTETGGKVLIAFFSWGGNTKGIAEEIRAQTGADLFEIEPVTPYSDDYNTVLMEAQRDQNRQARPKLKNRLANFEQYDTILLGYPKL